MSLIALVRLEEKEIRVGAVQETVVVKIGVPEIVEPLAKQAATARDEAVAAAEITEDALQEIRDLASGAPDAPSILNKAAKDGSNVEADAFRGAIGAAPTEARASLISPLSTVGIKATASALDADRLRSGYIPTLGQDVTITETVVVREPGVRIFGDGGATYNRGAGKKGWLMGASGLTRMFDLGAFRPYVAGQNPADNWEIDHLSLKQDPSAPINSVDGVSFTSRTDGPDRGAVIRSSSFVGLKDAITVENPDVSVTLASLNIEGCVFAGCGSALNAKGRLFGLRFVGNQCEQNRSTDGIIRGSIDGGVTIDDNMLEGQPNCISIDVPPTFGNRTRFSSKGNYFEANGGDYVYRFRANAPWSCEVGPNYFINLTAADYVLLDGCTSRGLLVVNDDLPVTFTNVSCTLEYGSDILKNGQRAYKVRRLNDNRGPEVVIANWSGLTDSAADHAHGVASSGPAVATPFGDRPCVTGSSFLTVPLAVAAGDLVSLNLMMSAAELAAGNLSFQVYDNTTTVKLVEWASGVPIMAGKWALVSIPFIAGASSPSLRVRFFTNSGSYATAILAGSAKNLGAHVNDGTVAAAISPAAPKIPAIDAPLYGSTAYAGGTIAAAGPASIVDVTVPGAVIGDFVTASFSLNTTGVLAGGYVRLADTVRLQLTNPTGADITLPAGTFSVRVSKKP